MELLLVLLSKTGVHRTAVLAGGLSESSALRIVFWDL
jgi:hypothetical protein